MSDYEQQWAEWEKRGIGSEVDKVSAEELARLEELLRKHAEFEQYLADHDALD